MPTRQPWRTVPSSGDYGVLGRRPRGEVDWDPYVRTANIAGSTLNYLDYGDAGPDEPVFVLAHGLGGRWQHWQENIPGLAEHGRVIAVDLPGFGRSQTPQSGYSLDVFADAIAELIEHLDLPKVVLVGHSLGGPLSVRFAIRHPQHVAGIVLAAGTVQAFAAVLGLRSTGGATRPRPATVAATVFEVLTAGLPAPAVVRRQIIARPMLRRLLLWPYLHRPDALPPQSVALLVDGVGARGVLPTARSVGRLGADQWLRQVGCPVLAIGADHDAVAPLSDLADFVATLPDAEAVVLEDTGHMVMLERADAFTDVLVDFARQVTRPA